MLHLAVLHDEDEPLIVGHAKYLQNFFRFWILA